MDKLCVAIENNQTLEGADYTNSFIRDYDGKVIELTDFYKKSKTEVFQAVSKCTDIAVQTCFTNGSDDQLYGMVKLLSKIPHSINVYIAYLGLSHQNDLRDYLGNNISPQDLVSIAHHKIYSMSSDTSRSTEKLEPHFLLDFSEFTKAIYDLEAYKNSALTRKTGRKILVLGCTAFGKAFENLPIGQEVDELDCHKLSTDGNSRGVWIMGNGEPIMLVNDHGFDEYKIVTKLSIEEILTEIGKTTDVDMDGLNKLEIDGILTVITDVEMSEMDKANFICEETGISKRSNRAKIIKLLISNLS